MNILIATNNLANTAGTQAYTYAIIQELIKLGHYVEYFTFDKGLVSKHGIIPGIEEPSCFADFHVCVSEYQKKYFSDMKIEIKK